MVRPIQVNLMDAIDFKQKYPDIHHDLLEVASELQDLILRIFPEPVISEDEDNIGYGFGSGYKDLVFVISPYKAHINLGIVNGAALEDPNSLMVGKGKVHRHAKLHHVEQVQSPDLMDLMLRALQAAQERIQ